MYISYMPKTHCYVCTIRGMLKDVGDGPKPGMNTGEFIPLFKMEMLVAVAGLMVLQ